MVYKNLLIAKFMGFKDSLNNNGREYTRWYNPNSTDYGKMYYPEDFKYDSNWNMLMLVIDKIENFGFNFYIGRSNVGIQVTSDSIGFFETAYCFRLNNEDKIIGAFNVAIEFIKWYNKNQKIEK